MTTTETRSTRALVHAAIAAAQKAYAPYSHYPVGAALRTTDGTIYTGCNVENASYSATICAERTALVKAVSEGQRQFEAIAVITDTGGFPCGTCRQVLYEFAPTLRVLIARPDGIITHDLPLNELLAHGFGPAHLAHTGDQ